MEHECQRQCPMISCWLKYYIIEKNFVPSFCYKEMAASICGGWRA